MTIMAPQVVTPQGTEVEPGRANGLEGLGIAEALRYRR